MNVTYSVFALIIAITFSSCKTTNDRSENYYKSTSNSFKSDFFLILDEKYATIYGWEVLLNKDTIYYKSKGVLKKSANEKLRIRFDKYEVSKKSFNRQNLNKFKNDQNLGSLDLIFYSEFSDGILLGETIKF